MRKLKKESITIILSFSISLGIHSKMNMKILLVGLED